MQIDLFDARMLAPLVRFLEQNGACSETFLDRVRIPGELIEAGGWITKKQAYDLTFDIVQRSRCPHAVFVAYQDFRLEQLGPIAEAMRCCKTVKEALEVAARLGSTAFEGNEYFLEVQGDTAWYCYREPKIVSAGQTFINDMTLAVYCQMVRAVIDDDQWRPAQLRIRDERIVRHSAAETFADCRSTAHHDSTGLAFPATFLGRRLEQSMKSLTSAALHDWRFGPDGSAPVVEKLYRFVASRFPYQSLPSLDELGALLDISPRTLKRQLASAGTTYRGLLDRLRFDAACEMLSNPQVTVREIACELGYSGTNNFVRSFRRMTGLTPGQYRQLEIQSDL